MPLDPRLAYPTSERERIAQRLAALEAQGQQNSRVAKLVLPGQISVPFGSPQSGPSTYLNIGSGSVVECTIYAKIDLPVPITTFTATLYINGSSSGLGINVGQAAGNNTAWNALNVWTCPIPYSPTAAVVASAGSAFQPIGSAVMAQYTGAAGLKEFKCVFASNPAGPVVVRESWCFVAVRS